MAGGYIYVYIFTALVAVQLIFADESNSLLSNSNQDDFNEIASREERSVDEEEAIEERFLFPVLTTCNYTATPGRYCASCTQAARCYSTGVSIVRRCYLFTPYCNNGYCSFTAESSCNSTLVTG